MKFKNLTYTMAFWLLRFWLAARAIGTGLTKFQGKKEVVKDAGGLSADDVDILQEMASNAAGGPPTEKVTETVQALGFEFYHGLPEKGPMTIETFSASPLMPSFMVGPYAWSLGYALIALGLALALGICTRVTLFFMGLLYISLTWGFIIMEPSMGPSAAAGIAYLGVHVALIVGALLLADYNKFELVKCKCGCLCKCDCEGDK